MTRRRAKKSWRVSATPQLLRREGPVKTLNRIVMSLKSEQTVPKVRHMPSACHCAIPGNYCFEPDRMASALHFEQASGRAQAEMRLITQEPSISRPTTPIAWT